ncbi:DNA polymerase III subunit [Porphyromonas cangingivalis]
MLSKEKRPLFSDWKTALRSENRQPQMYISEAEYLQHKLSYKSFQSKYRIVLVWLPELMNTPCANTLLKLIEEPPPGVIFLMVSTNPSAILPTIYSRLQRIRTATIPQNKIERYLSDHFGISSSAATEVSHLSQGNLRKALDLLRAENEGDYFSKFREASRILYLPIKGDPKLIKEKAEELHKLQRSEAIELLDIMLDVIREANSTIYGEPGCQYTRSEDKELVQQIANFQTLGMIPKMMEHIMTARAELSQNVMVKIVYFDLLVTLSLLFRGK